MLASLARGCYRRRRLTLLVWVLLLVGMSVLGGRVGELSRSFRATGTESQQAFDLLRERFPQAAGDTGRVVVRADGGLAGAGVQQRLAALVAELRRVPEVGGVDDFGGPAAAFRTARDGRVAYTDVRFLAEGMISDETRAGIDAAVERAEGPGLQVELGGQQFQEPEPPGSSEGAGLVAAVVILLVAFGSVLAMGLPIVMALFGIGIGLALVQVLGRLITIPEFATQVAAMIGIGVGIDYALFIVTRYRTALRAGLEPEAAVVEAISTAGKAVVFAGITVVISLLGMLLMGLDFIRGLGIGASAVVLVSIAASVTLLPAALGFAGRTIDRFALPGFHERQARAGQGFWWRWSRTVAKRPWPFALGGLALLLVLAAPVLDLRLGAFDASSDPEGSTTREAYDLLREGFGPGFNGPFLVAVELPRGAADLPVAQALSQRLGATPGVALATPPQASPAGDAAILQVIPTTGPIDVETERLLERIRQDVVPAAVGGTGVRAYVGGSTAVFDDLTAVLTRRLPLFIGAVLLLSFLLLLAVFRSILVPLKAVLMNLLSIGAAYGVLVAVFQKGWGASLIGVSTTGPIISFAPMMLFAILFGLSMDYEVFLLSRVKEEFDRTGDNTAAVADGLAATARVITAAAAIMITVFGSFVLGDDVVVKEFGLGLSVAIFLDATVVRLVLVPATMELLGAANWWFPSWLDRLVPRISVEGGEHVGGPA